MLAYFEENAAQVSSLTSDSGPLGKVLQGIENVSVESGNARGADIIKGFAIDPEDKEVSDMLVVAHVRSPLINLTL